MKSNTKKRNRTCVIFGALGVFALGAIIAVGAYFYFFGNLPWLSGAEIASGPAVSIQEPANGTEVKTGASFPISAFADDENGVIRLDLWVDDTVVLSQESLEAGGLTPLTLNYPLAAVKPGTYALMARAYNSLGELGESAIHYVTVADSNVSTQDYAQYVIKEGDTLENIASRLGVTVDSIRQANPQLGPGPLQPGQVIVVPAPSKKPAQAAVPPQSGAQPVNQQQQNAQKQKAPDPANPSKQISVTSANVNPSPVYYGQKCTTETSVINVVAKVEPANSVSKVNLTYSYIDKAGAKTKKPEVAMQLSAGEYKGSVDVKKDAETLFGQDGGKVEVLVEAHDKDGKVSISSLYTVTVSLCQAQGGAVQIPPNQGGVQWQGPGIVPAHIDKFAPGAISQAGPGLDQIDPSLFPDHRIAVLPPDFGSVNSPTEGKAISIDGCKVSLTWKDNATDETGYEIFRAGPGHIRFNRIALLPPDTQQYEDRTPTTGNYRYYVLAVRLTAGKGSVGDSKIFSEDVKTTSNCQVTAGPKRLFFQPVEFSPKDGAITQGYLLVTLNGFSPFRVPRSGQSYLPTGDWTAAGEWAIPLPETVLMNPGDLLSVEARGSGGTPKGPKDLKGFQEHYSYEYLVAPEARNKLIQGTGTDFSLTYRMWLNEWQWGGKISNPALPAPTNMQVNTSDPFQHSLKWDYDSKAKPLIDGFIVYAKYSCPAGPQEHHHVVTKNVTSNQPVDQKLRIPTVKQPTGCNCIYQASAFNNTGESKLSDPTTGACKTGSPEKQIQVTFETFQIIQDKSAQFHYVDQASELYLFAGKFSRSTPRIRWDEGFTYFLETMGWSSYSNFTNRFVIPTPARPHPGDRAVYSVPYGFYVGDSICSKAEKVFKIDQTLAATGKKLPFTLTSSCGTGCTCKLTGWINALPAGKTKADKDIGEGCSNDSECDPGICKSNYCAPKSKGWDGAKCFANDQCASGICQCFSADRYGAGQLPYPCPPIAVMKDYTLGTCLGPTKEKLVNGSQCSKKSECASDNCYKGLCAPKDGLGRLGDYCHHNDHCFNNYCKCPHGYDGDLCKGYMGFTPQSGRHGTCGERRGEVHGGFCREGYECLSGHCAENKCAPIDGTGLLGEYCHHDAHCYGGTCNCPDNRKDNNPFLWHQMCTDHKTFSSSKGGQCDD